jgi:hypothetical protein
MMDDELFALEDMDFVEHYLEKLKFPKSGGINGTRKKLDAHGRRPEIALFGQTLKVKTREVSESFCSKKYPSFEKVFRQIAENAFPDLAYTHIQVNKNHQTLPHRDKQNIGDSITFCLGKFQGGRLVLTDTGEKIDIYKKPYLFDGSAVTHHTEPFTGTRYCVIYYNNPKLGGTM